MTAGLNLARASCAAASSDGSVSSSVRSSRQAALREIGVEPAFANSAAVADSASERKVAISLFLLLFFLLRNSFHPSRRIVWRSERSYRRLLAKIIADPENPCLSSFRENIRLRQNTPHRPLVPLLQHTAKVVNISTLDNVNSWEQNSAV